MLISFLKCLHLICGTSFLGFTVASFFYITYSIHQQDRTLIDYSLRASYFGDGLILFCVIVQLSSALILVSAGHFSLAIPWIFIAYSAFSSLVLLWLINFFIKYCYLSDPVITPFILKIYYCINSTMILIFIIIHDAVMRSTWFEFLLRK